VNKQKPVIRRVDNNQADLVAVARGIGATVTHLHTLGHGVPDLLISYQGKWFVVEVKSDDGELTEDEQKWIIDQRAPVCIWHNANELLRDLTRPEIDSVLEV